MKPVRVTAQTAPPICGVDHRRHGEDHAVMDKPSSTDIARLQTLVDLRDQLVELHARLEYVRLMLRMRGR